MKLKLFVLNVVFCFWITNTFAAVVEQTSFNDTDNKYLTYTENFSPEPNGASSNVGGWFFGGLAKAPFGKTKGSVNGIYYREVDDQIAQVGVPAFVSTTPSVFTGNYVKNKVIELRLTTQVVSEFVPVVRPMTLVILNLNQGTYLYKANTDCRDNKDKCPTTSPLATTWSTYYYKIPQSVAEAQAANWQLGKFNAGGCSKLADCFDVVMSNVQRVAFVYGNPTVVYDTNPLLKIMATDVSIKKMVSP